MTRDYRDLAVWEQAMELCESVYVLLRKFPVEEKYALCDQLRRAVVSIPSNIAWVRWGLGPMGSDPIVKNGEEA